MNCLLIDRLSLKFFESHAFVVHNGIREVLDPVAKIYNVCFLV